MHAFDIAFPRGSRRTCHVCVGSAALARLVDDLARLEPGRPLVAISDSTVAPLHAAPLARRLADRGFEVRCLTFPAGEASKDRRTKAELEDRLFELGLGRDGMLLAVGGGVTGDLVGFLAATWQRGVPIVQVPTSLLAMADSALGGKTAVDLPGGKNLIGAFHQPWGLYADVAVLATLPQEFYVEGLAEMVKTAVVGDAALFGVLEREADALLGRDRQTLEECLTRCLALKARVVRRDEREAGPRAALNFGHTVAHALETLSGYGLRHGRAVAIGMVVEGELACELHGFPRSALGRVRSLLERFGLPTRPPEVSVERWLEATRADKKARGGRVHYALPRRIGRMPPGDLVSVAVDDRLARAAWSRASSGPE